MAKALTIDEAKNKIYDLTKRLFELERDKKAEMKDFRERDGELKGEIEDALEKKEQKAITEADAKSKVFEATKQRMEINKEKKAVSTEYKDEISDVTSEIFAIFAEQADQNTQGTNP
jgi:hypothetical protein